MTLPWSRFSLGLSCAAALLSSGCASTPLDPDSTTDSMEETGTSSASSEESGGESGDEGYCEISNGGGAAAFDIDVSQWPVDFWDSSTQILDCSVASAEVSGVQLTLEFDCTDGTNSGRVSIEASGQTDISSPLAVGAQVELELHGDFAGGGANVPVPIDLGYDEEEFIVRDDDGLVIGGFENVGGFRDVWSPVSFSHARLCFREYDDFAEVPHFEAGLRVGDADDETDLELGQNSSGEWTAPDGRVFRVESGSATTWGCCHGGTSNYGLVRRLNP